MILASVTLSVPNATTAQTDSAFVSVAEENIRAAPGGAKIGVLNGGTAVKAVGQEGKWLRIQIEAWIWQPSTVSSRAELGPEVTTSTSVEFLEARVERLPSDFSRDSKPYSAHVRAYFKFRNNSSKVLTGLIYVATFKDSFGDILYRTEIKDQLKIAPGSTSKMASFWYWEDNEFIDGEPYDKMQAAASAGTVGVSVSLKKAVFEDGTIQTF